MKNWWGAFGEFSTKKTTMDEFSAVLRARELVASVNPSTIPILVEAYVEQIGAALRRDDDLGTGEAGYSVMIKGRHHICVNAKERPERQRFTICHEVAHIFLDLPSDHAQMAWWSYAKRSANEVACDVFAAELLLPYRLFKPAVEGSQIGFAAIAALAERFEASITATGSRFATMAAVPCAFVLSEKGKIRYSSRSTSLRDAGAWIVPRSAMPDASASQRVRSGGQCNGPEEVAADLWFNDWNRGGVLLEEACHLGAWDQTLTLLWFEDEEVPRGRPNREAEEEEFGLAELDGILPWPGTRKRRP